MRARTGKKRTTGKQPLECYEENFIGAKIVQNSPDQLTFMIFVKYAVVCAAVWTCIKYRRTTGTQRRNVQLSFDKLFFEGGAKGMYVSTVEENVSMWSN